MSNEGLQQRYRVERTDGSSAPGGKHHECETFTLDPKHDPYARVALEAYATACETELPALASDLRDLLRRTSDSP